ncbi:metallophosphoesterase [Amycolatopsis sp. NBC_00345]|uniref:metallophosphoesterase n=1 Tax=Amycolatopsis sp. NBC_00345 TaxID=2975955 RepID=UPI002E266A29
MSTLSNASTSGVTAKRVAVGTVALGAATLGYAIGIERRLWTLRTAELPVLAPGAKPFTILHISDLHMLPGHRAKQRWVAALDKLEPDLVVNTGDNLSHRTAVPSVLRALGPLLDRPGLFVFGSNDYYAPKPKNPARYLMPKGKKKRIHGTHLPWRDLRAAFLEHGWTDVTHVRRTIEVAGRPVFAAGVDDPHLRRDRYSDISGPADATAAVRLGITHSPEPRVLDPFATDGYDLVLAGHTHGGQLRLPGYGALVTNCELDRTRARGASRWGAHMWLHVSAGLGTSPYAPARFACRPEASLLTLVPRGTGAAETSKTTPRKPSRSIR